MDFVAITLHELREIIQVNFERKSSNVNQHLCQSLTCVNKIYLLKKEAIFTKSIVLTIDISEI